MKVLIIGGGASGMMAALSAAEDGSNRVMLLERQGRVGRKLLATGNGRCNLTNLGADASRYHGAAPEFVKPALERFGVQRTLDYFRALGLLTVAEADGKVYPLSDQASSVLDVLRFAVELRGVTVVPSCDVIEVKKKAREGIKVKSFRVVKVNGEEVSRELLRDDYYKEVQGEVYQGVTPREGTGNIPEEGSGGNTEGA